MSLVDLIECKQSIIPDVIEDLKIQQIPLVVLGASNRGKYLYSFLCDNGIEPSHIAVTKSYYKQNCDVVMSNGRILTVECLDELLKMHEKINLIFGLPPNLLPKELKMNEKINKSYTISVGTAPGYVYSYEYFKQNEKVFEKFYSSLSDDLSRDLMVAHINGRIQGRYIEFPPAPWTDPVYFLPEVMNWKPYESVMDCGAFTGDTAEEFLAKMPTDIVQNYRLYCWEPDISNYEILKRNFKANRNVICLNFAAYSTATKVYFNGGRGKSGRISDTDEGVEIQTETIDHIAASDKITMIKMDIEGGELEALKGAEKTIKRDKPRLAVCLYHKKEDMITIPQYIESLNPEYSFYLRTHSAAPTELVLYCV